MYLPILNVYSTKAMIGSSRIIEDRLVDDIDGIKGFPQKLFISKCSKIHIGMYMFKSQK